MLSELEDILSDILLIDDGRLILYSNIDELRQSAYRLEGGKNRLEAFCGNKKMIYIKHGDMNSIAVIHEPFDDSTVAKTKRD